MRGFYSERPPGLRYGKEVRKEESRKEDRKEVVHCNTDSAHPSKHHTWWPNETLRCDPIEKV